MTDGFRSRNGTLTSLGSFAATAINDNGVMAGGPDIDTNGTSTDLTAVLPAGSPTIRSAAGINDNGQTAATAATPQRRQRAADPGLKPAPATGDWMTGSI